MLNLYIALKLENLKVNLVMIKHLQIIRQKQLMMSTRNRLQRFQKPLCKSQSLQNLKYYDNR